MDCDDIDRSIPPEHVPRAFTERLSLLLVRAGDQIASRGNAALEDELAITGRDYTALAVIEHDQPSSQQELARLMGKAPALCVGMLDDLEAKQLVARVRDPKDRRRSIVTLTDEGRSKLAKADVLARRIEEQVLGELSDDDRSALQRVVGGLAARA